MARTGAPRKHDHIRFAAFRDGISVVIMELRPDERAEPA
jgi:hypothetical protein